MPAVFTVLILLLSVILSRIPGFGQVMPLFTLINIYYWSVFYPGILPYWFLFALGMVQDTLTGQPLGFSSFINIVFVWMLSDRLRLQREPSFAAAWLKFAVSASAIILLEWIVMGIYYHKILPLSVPALRWFSSCLAYPPVHFLLAALYRRIDNGKR